ncbi:MAG TPA: TetR family transcriptional regulator [Steroidobacteraceae bacterium]|nr:TetR family transcriptional regulator [Steroidobacteraceae bacterium]
MNATIQELVPENRVSDKQPSRHEELLDQSARQLNVRGVLRTSLAEIAAKLGVSRNALYYYVSGREELLFQCYQRAAQISAARLTDAIRAGGNAADVLTQFVVRTMDPKGPEIAYRTEIAMLNPAQRVEIQALREALIMRLAELIETGQRQGVIRACDPDINARVALSVTSWVPLSRRWMAAVEPQGASRLQMAAVQTLVEGLSPHVSPGYFQPLDLSELVRRGHRAFDRDGASEAKRELVLRTASRLFNRKGIDSTSLEEIAAQVGATKRTVYHHLGNKQALVMACYERAYRIFFFIIDGMKAHPGTRLEALAAALHAVALAYPDEDLTPLSPLVGFATLVPKARAKMNDYGLRLSSDYRSVLRQGIKEGSLREVDVTPHTLMLAGLTSWLVREDMPTEPTRRQQIAQEIANLVMVGLATRAVHADSARAGPQSCAP